MVYKQVYVCMGRLVFAVLVEGGPSKSIAIWSHLAQAAMAAITWQPHVQLRGESHWPGQLSGQRAARVHSEHRLTHLTLGAGALLGLGKRCARPFVQMIMELSSSNLGEEDIFHLFGMATKKMDCSM